MTGSWSTMTITSGSLGTRLLTPLTSHKRPLAAYGDCLGEEAPSVGATQRLLLKANRLIQAPRNHPRQILSGAVLIELALRQAT